MFCHNCGVSVAPGQNFCCKCGRPLGPEVGSPSQEPPLPRTGESLPWARGRIERHAKVLAILWLVFSLYRLIPALALIFGGGVAMHFIPLPVRAYLLPIAGVVGMLLTASSVLGLLAGWGLLEYRPWARGLTLIVGIISLIHFPVGTALGIYTLWVLLPAESEREYRYLTRMAAE